MPHIILEHSKEIKTFGHQDFFTEVHNYLSIITKKSSLKTRSYSPEIQNIGDNNDDIFICLTLKLLKKPDRTPELKKKLATDILKILNKHANKPLEIIKSNNQNLKCHITVEVIDIADSYAKVVI